MGLRKTAKGWWKVLCDPKGAYAAVGARTLESLVGEYFRLLGALSLALFVSLSAMSIGRALLYAFAYDAHVRYPKLISYTIAGAAGGAFFVLFAGTFLLFFASLLARIVYRDLPYVDVVRALLLATAPLLLFGWIAPLAPALLVWSIVLFIAGVPALRAAKKAKRGTLQERE